MVVKNEERIIIFDKVNIQTSSFTIGAKVDASNHTGNVTKMNEIMYFIIF